jgi:rhombotail lipoprotein
LKYLWLVVLVFLCGCANGFDRAALQERLNDGLVQTNDQDIAAARALKPQLRFPCRMAIYLKPGDHEWRWTHEDRMAMETWAYALKKEGIASEVFPLPEMLTGKGSDVKELRLAAAKCGADVLFVIHGAAQTDSYKNFASVLNLTVVGGYVVPGSHKDSLFMMEGMLLDVDNGFIYTGVQAEGVGKIIRPTFIIEEKDAIAQAKTKAIAEFGNEVLQRLRRMAAGPPLIADANWKGITVPDANGVTRPPLSKP